MKRLFLIILLISVSSSANGSPILRFQALSVEQGLPNTTVWVVEQDKDGYIWLGTSNGLARFDGYELKTFLKEIKPPGIFDKTIIRALTTDNDGNLWVGTLEGGLHRYNRLTEEFSNFHHINYISNLDQQELNDKSLPPSQVISLAIDRKNQLWVGTTSGVNKVDLVSGNVTHYRSEGQDEKAKSKDYIYTIFLDNSDTIWIGTKNGVAFYDQAANTFSDVKLTENSQPRVRSITSGSDENLLIGTHDGLFQYNHSKQSVKHITQGIEKPIVLSVVFDDQENVWIATFDKGIFKIAANNQVSQFSYDRAQARSLSDDTILSLLLDREDNLWIGTFSGGVNWVNENSRNFGLYNDNKSSIPCLPSPTIYAVHFDSKDELWLGSSLGLTRFNRKNGNCYNFDYKPGNSQTLSDNKIYSIQEDSQGNLWIGTGKGLDLIQPGSTLIKQLDNFPKEVIYAIEESFTGDFYIGTNKGFYVKDKDTDDFRHVRTFDQTTESIDVRAINIDPGNRVFVATDKGLYWLNKAYNQLEFVQYKQEPVIASPVSSLYRDIENHLWVGAERRGLLKLDENNKVTRSITTKDGLPTIREISDILADKNGNLWVSSPKGIAQIDLKKNVVSSYRSGDGLQGESFIRGAASKSKEGEIVFGGRYGLNIFDPNTIHINQMPPQVYITDFFHFNKRIVANDKDAKFQLDKPISQTRALELSHRDYIIGFELAALHFSDPTRNRYAYMMEGLDPEWNYTDASNRHVNVTYNNLRTGDYTFRVKAANKDGIWNETGTKIAIRVLPAPWMTWWAFTIYVLTTLLLIVFVIYKRTSILRQRAIELEKTVSERTTELREEKQKVEQLLSRKNEEFANVSHEFRTPLTLMLGPLSQVLKTNKTENEIRRLNVVQRNGYRLLRMVDQLLNLETFRVKSITQKSPQATGKIIGLLSEAFNDIAKEKGISVSVKNICDVNFEFTADAFEKIFVNLISNAIKYTKSGGSIEVESNRTPANELHIRISDTGIGIPKDKQEAIFERYNRVLDENSEQVTGAGIGLALVKSLVEAHKGRIDLESELGKGTTVNVYLPIIGEVGDIDLANHSNDEIIAMEMMSLTHESISEPTESIADASEVDENKPQILVIEDNDDMSNYIVESISSKYRVIVAENGEKGYELAKAEVPDLIVSDIMMPVMDGYQATHKIRTDEVTSHIPIILLTARGDRESRLKGWYEKADEYLTKPFDVEELLIRIHNLLEIRDIIRQRFCQSVFSQERPKLDSSKSAENESRKSESKEWKFIQKVDTALGGNYQRLELKISELAELVAMSERQFARKIKATTNITCAEYIKRYRLEKAKVLLEKQVAPSTVWMDVGFSSHSHFGKCFKAQYGCTPSEYLN